MNNAKTRYSAFVGLNGLYELVVASEGVEPYIGPNWLLGIDPPALAVVLPFERLAIPEGTLEGSVVLIKGGQGGGEKEIYRLFHVEVRALIEVERPLIGGWTFDQSDGNLVTDFVHGFLKVAPTDWGYCQIISELWSAESYIENALKQLGLEVPHGGIDWSAANYWKDLLSGSIKDRQRAEKLEIATLNLDTTLRQIARMIYGEDLLRRGSALHALLREPGTVHFAANRIAKKLEDMFKDCQDAVPRIEKPLTDFISSDD